MSIAIISILFNLLEIIIQFHKNKKVENHENFIIHIKLHNIIQKAIDNDKVTCLNCCTLCVIIQVDELGSSTAPVKITAPEIVSLIMNINGCSATKFALRGGVGAHP